MAQDCPSYEVRFTQAAKKDLRKLSQTNQEAASKAIDALAALSSEPRPARSKRLSGVYSSYRRIRVGNMRAVYRIQDSVLEILVIAVGDRANIYETLGRRVK